VLQETLFSKREEERYKLEEFKNFNNKNKIKYK
jgi:hypothetical protein